MTEFLPGIEFEGAQEMAPLWDQFTREYTQAALQYNAKSTNFLHQLAFGVGVEKFFAHYNIKSEITNTTYKDTKERIEDVCKHISVLADSEATRPLNREVVRLLIIQWIELGKKYDLYPPPSISRSEGTKQDQIDEVLKRRTALMKSPEGSLVAGALRMALDNTLRAQSYNVYYQLKKTKDYDDILLAAYDVFKASLFTYELGHSAAFPYFVQKGLMDNLRTRVIRGSDDELISLDCTQDDDQRPLKETLVDKRESNPLESLISGNRKDHIRGVVDKLHPRYREILYLRFGLEDHNDRTLEETAQELGITAEWVRQLEKKALVKLQEAYQAIHGKSLQEFFQNNFETQSSVARKQRLPDLKPNDFNPKSKHDKLSFGEQVELALDNNPSFDRFLDQLLTEEWDITPQQFRKLVKHNIEERLRRARLQEDFDEASLPQAIKQYLERKTTKDSYLHEFPEVDTIEAWQAGKYNPRGNYVAQMAYAFGLSPRQEHQLWKLTYGKELSRQQLDEALDRNNSGEVATLLVRASGIMQTRLCEMLGANPSTLSGWLNSENPAHISDLDVADKFTSLLLQSLEWNNLLPESPDNAALKKRIMGIMFGQRLENIPSSPEHAAGQFAALLDDSFARKHNFNQFLKNVTDTWDVTPPYLNFLNTNNAEYITDYQPISRATFYEWAANEGIALRSHAIEKIVAGSFMSEEQELKLWKMIHGKRVTVDEVKGALAEGNSGKLVGLLYQASGIGRNRVMHLLSSAGDTDEETGDKKPQLSEHHNPSTLVQWMDPDNTYKIRKLATAERLVDLLIPHIGWPEQDPLPTEEMEALRMQVIEQLTGKRRTTPLGTLVEEAKSDPKPSGRLCQMLARRMGDTNEVVADKIGLTPKMLIHCKSGNNVLKESEAITLIGLAGGGNEADVINAVNVLTKTRSPAELLKEMEANTITPGAVLAETRKRRKLTQNDVPVSAEAVAATTNQKHYVAKLAVLEFEKGNPTEVTFARHFADFIGYKGEDKRRFIVRASGHAPAPVADIAGKLEQRQCSRMKALRELCSQSAQNDDTLTALLGLENKRQLRDVLAGKMPGVVLPEQGVREIAVSAGLEPDGPVSRLCKALKTGAAGIVDMVEAGEIERGNGLQALLDAAALNPRALTSTFGIPTGMGRLPQLLQHPKLPDVLRTVAERTHMDTTAAGKLPTLFGPQQAAGFATQEENRSTDTGQRSGH